MTCAFLATRRNYVDLVGDVPTNFAPATRLGAARHVIRLPAKRTQPLLQQVCKHHGDN